MAKKRPPNPNTAYGRRRIQEDKFLQEQQWRIDHPKEAAQDDNTKMVFGLLILTILIILAIIVRMQNYNDHYGPRGGHFKVNKHGNKEYLKK